ncbi:MAG: OmpH family outer membrane protein [Bacteroidetes bacterium]|nr:OmpH family outer membrane protein [Bacteroidota bacterium]MBU1680007.1 OmpH family outer membrane protein [Bacteroidota bacterium]MBU2505912.1 OmpH family outer membrane protein [Bacteroidota bacterium]
MKKLILFLILLFPVLNQAQLKIGYVDSDTIMKNLPDAQDAQKKLDGLIAEWKEDLRKMETDFQKKYEDYEKRKLILSEQKRVETEKELIKLETDINDYRQKKFGVNGELFTNQNDVMKPVQNKIFNAIQLVAKEKELDFVFDRSGDILFLYAKEEYDITNLVLEKLK